MPKLLTLLSNPDTDVKLRMDREVKTIMSCINQKVAHDFDCKAYSAINIEELAGLVLKERPEIIHFCGHGSKKTLTFEDSQGNGTSIGSDALCDIFSEVSEDVTLLILNACDSGLLAKRLSSYIPFTVGFPGKVADQVSESFSRSFYESLSGGLSVPAAFKVARATISHRVTSSKLPKLFQNKRLANHGKLLFKDPYLVASFDVNDRGNPIKDAAGHYEFTFDVKNIPKNVGYLIYEFVDDTIKPNERYHLIEDPSSGTFCDEWGLYGDIIVRVWLWFGERKYGIGLESTLSVCLKKYYKNKIPNKFAIAFKQILNN
jgi:hypothetical protein